MLEINSRIPLTDSTVTERRRIAIAGGGLLGRLFAWRLHSLGHQVTLLEAGHFSPSASAAFTAAAMISPLSEVVVSEKCIYDYGINSIALWEQWLSLLPDSFAPLYQNRGSIVVAHPSDAAELRQFKRELQFHLGAGEPSEWLDRRSLVAMEPDLNPAFDGGLYLPNEAFIDNRPFLDALLHHVRDRGVICREQATVTLTATPAINGEPLKDVDLLIDTRGIGAKESQPQLRGVRGEVVWVETPEVALSRPIRLMHPRYKLYIVPKGENHYILGATEIESEDRSPMTVQSAMELCSALYTLNPAFAEARILEIDSNLRPSLLDNLPKIAITPADPSQRQPEIISVNGLYRHGYLLAPTLVENTLSYIQGTHPNAGQNREL